MRFGPRLTLGRRGRRDKMAGAETSVEGGSMRFPWGTIRAPTT